MVNYYSSSVNYAYWKLASFATSSTTAMCDIVGNFSQLSTVMATSMDIDFKMIANNNVPQCHSKCSSSTNGQVAVTSRIVVEVLQVPRGTGITNIYIIIPPTCLVSFTMRYYGFTMPSKPAFVDSTTYALTSPMFGVSYSTNAFDTSVNSSEFVYSTGLTIPTLTTTKTLNANGGLTVGGSTVIDASRNGIFSTLSNTANLYSTGFSNVGGNIYASSITANTLSGALPYSQLTGTPVAVTSLPYTSITNRPIYLADLKGVIQYYQVAGSPYGNNYIAPFVQSGTHTLPCHQTASRIREEV